jgi:hypothetical protein
MLTIPQAVLRDCHAVFRRIVARSSAARLATTIHVTSTRDGIRLALTKPDIAVEYHHPCHQAEGSVTLPLAALTDCEGRGSGIVRFTPRPKGRVDVCWEDAGVPCQREYVPRESSPLPFPAWPGRDSANEPSLLAALADAMEIPTGDPGRLSLTCVQLRGRQGDVVATDGRQMLIQGGFRFPWKDALLVPRTSVFAARELLHGDTVLIAQNKKHVFVRVGNWTIVLPIETSARYPNVDAVIPNSAHVATTWHVAPEEAPALASVLDDLPGAKEEHSPVTIDLTGLATIRARGGDEQRCTEVALPDSRCDGKPIRIATGRRFLQRALRLGFRTLQFTSPDKPILCRDGQRVFVWVPLDPASVLPPQARAVRVALPLSAETRQSKVVTLPARPRLARVPGRTAGRVHPARFFDGFRICAQGLWALLRKHRQQQLAK